MKKGHVPKYRHHKPSGQAFIQFRGKREYLGKHGTPESLARYQQRLSEIFQELRKADSAALKRAADDKSNARRDAPTDDPGVTANRGGGSICILAAWRAAWIVGRDPDEEGSFVMAMNKCNLAAKPKSLRYRIEGHHGVSRIRWLGECDLQPDDILSARRTRRAGKAEVCAELIQELLADDQWNPRNWGNCARTRALHKRHLPAQRNW